MDIKPRLIKAISSNSIGLFVDETLSEDRIAEMHVHCEYELIYIYSGKVKLWVGDNECDLSRGDVVLIGPQLSHQLKCDDNARITSMYFDKKVILDLVHAIADLSNLDDLLNKATWGIRFYPSDEQVGVLLESLRNADGVDRVITLFQLYKNLLIDKQYKRLSSEGYTASHSDWYVEDRLREVHAYIRENLNKKITLQELADKANMSPPAFSNFYTKKTGKTVFQQINETRIGRAKKLIIESDMTISEVAKACGYPSTTFFNRQFKKITNKPPTGYKKSFLEMAV